MDQNTTALPSASVVAERLQAARIAMAKARRELSDLVVATECDELQDEIRAAESSLSEAIDNAAAAYGTASNLAIEEALDVQEPAVAAGA